MVSRSKSLSDEWLLSALLHVMIAALVLGIALGDRRPRKSVVEISVLESPKVSPKAVEMREPPKVEKPAAQRKVFGQSRRALVTDNKEAVQVKAGNTVAKERDDEKLRADDKDSLPIPADEYLVTQMPELARETQVPYPAGARARKVQGAVIMDILIDAAGQVREAKLVEGPDAELNQAALAAVRSFQFRPAQVQDKPVAVRIRYAYRFVLEK